MNDEELRRLVRDAIARQAARPAPSTVQAAFHLHASQAMFTLPAGADADGPCIIEPAVTCNHCGYCKSYGH